MSGSRSADYTSGSSSESSRSVDFVTNEAIRAKEYECQFIRESFQAIVSRKDKLLEQQEQEIQKLKKQLRQEKQIIYVHSPRHARSAATMATEQGRRNFINLTLVPRKMSSRSSTPDQLQDIHQYNELIEQHIDHLQVRLDDNQSDFRKFENKVSSLSIKLKRKEEDIKLLQQECAKYYDQCSDLNRIEEIIQNAQVVWEKEIVLNAEQRITVERLMQTAAPSAQHVLERNQIERIAATLQRNFNKLHGMNNADDKPTALAGSYGAKRRGVVSKPSELQKQSQQIGKELKRSWTKSGDSDKRMQNGRHVFTFNTTVAEEVHADLSDDDSRELQFV